MTDLNLALAGLSVTDRNPSDSACTTGSELYVFRHLSVDENQAGFVKSDIVNIISHHTTGGEISHKYKGKEEIVVGHIKRMFTYPLLPTTASLCAKAMTMCA